MKKRLIVILVLVVALSVNAQKKGKAKTNPDAVKWMKKYGRAEKWAANGKTSESIERRCERVLQKKNRCAKHNANPDATWECGSNEHDALTSEEFQSRLMGVRPPMEPRALPKAPVFNSFMPSNVPPAVDWAIYCPPIYNQGSCGDCWAFAALSTIECWAKMKGYSIPPLSPQFLVDCDINFNNWQCNGGWPTRAFDKLIANFNTSCAAWADYPYTSFTYTSTNTGYSTCKTAPTRYPLYFTTPYQVNVNGNEAVMKYLLANFGPVAIGMYATSPMGSYRSGVFTDPLCPKGNATISQCDYRYINHAIIITGYDVLDGKPVWKIRNSWGTSWGQSGYGYMLRDATNNCNSACFAMFVDN